MMIEGSKTRHFCLVTDELFHMVLCSTYSTEFRRLEIRARCAAIDCQAFQNNKDSIFILC